MHTPRVASERLVWSRRGDVSCQSHAPSAASERWLTEGWAPVPPGMAQRGHYQCQWCHGTPIGHGDRERRSPLILSVDADSGALRRRARQLRDSGFAVVNAASLAAAARVARRRRPHLVLVAADLMADARLALEERLPGVPLVAIGRRLDSLITPVDGRGDGVDAFILEPAGGHAMEVVLQRLLAGASA